VQHPYSNGVVSDGHHELDHRAVLRAVQALRTAPPAREARGLRALTARARRSFTGDYVMAGAAVDSSLVRGRDELV
jgi:hypothetical protein